MPTSPPTRANPARIDPTSRPRRPPVLRRARRTARSDSKRERRTIGDGLPAVELPTLSNAIAERFDDLPALYDTRDDYRYLVATGVLVRAVTITTLLDADDAIVLIGIDIDL